ncbi:MAG: SDR family NAD(P)-dependent oxidoreductase [Bacteroidales bacterium]
MKIAITGASGHIGNNLCRELIKQGHTVKVLVHNFEKSLKDIDCQIIRGDICDFDKVDKLVENADYVFHTAAIISIGNTSREKIFAVNINGTRNVAEACIKHGVKRLIHFSSIHALSNNSPDKNLNETNPLVGNKAFNYDQSKAEGERIVLDAIGKGLDAIILNPASVVGPNDYVPSLIGQMLIQIALGKMPFLIKGGYHFVDVRDIVEAAINAMYKGRPGERYLLTSEFKSLKEIADFTCEIARVKKTIVVPDFMAWIGLPFISLFSLITRKPALYTRESLTIVSTSPKIVNNKKAIDEIGFIPRPAKDTFYDALNWFIQNKYIQINT